MKKIILFVILFLSFLGCQEKHQLKKFEKERFLFGTYIRMVVFSEDREKSEKAMELAFEKIGEIDTKYNSKTKNSSIYKLNHSENKEIILDDEGIELFQNIKKVYILSGGKYDITISPLLDLWGFGNIGIKKIPSEKDIREVLKKIDFNKVIIEKNKLILREPVKALDTGSFLKGYAIEKAKQILQKEGIKYALITSISSLSSVNGKEEGRPWNIGIQDPSDTEKILGVLELEGKSLGISGDYQTYIEINGEKYHHIMDKETGYPVKDKKLVVVISDSSFYADMYSTAFFNMKIKDIFKKAEELNLEVLIVDNKNKIKSTKNFKLKQ